MSLSARIATLFLFAASALLPSLPAQATIKLGQVAPDFKLSKQSGEVFSLASRKGQGWTILYFYPKAGSPGCTDQACAFRDSIKLIRAKNAEVYGISSDSVESQLKFHTEHKLAFDLLADPDGKVIELYDVKFPIFTYAKRWTFILDPELVVRHIDDDVDPVMDAKKSAEKLEELQKAAAPAAAQAPTTP